MFNIDRLGLTTAIAVSLSSLIGPEDDERSIAHQYFLIAIDMAKEAMNSGIRNLDDAVEEQIDRYRDDKYVPWLNDIVRQLVFDIKSQFITAGFDSRLKYKVVTHQLGKGSTHKYYGIAMDLDETCAVMEEQKNTAAGEQELIYVVSEQPTLEQLNQVYKW